jgi:hypothetical protein
MKNSKVEYNIENPNNTIQLKCEVECANPKVELYRWTYNQKELSTSNSSNEYLLKFDEFALLTNQSLETIEDFQIVCTASNQVKPNEYLNESQTSYNFHFKKSNFFYLFL